MKKIKKSSVVGVLALLFALVVINPSATLAASTPSLGMVSTYAVLASTYTNTSAGTVINGDVGFVTGPAVIPGGIHLNYGSGAPYATAGADQNIVLTNLSSELCTFTFGAGAVDLSSDTTHGPIGVYTPGVYCSIGAMNIGSNLSLNGNGTFIFRSAGAFTTTAGANIIVNGGSSCNVFWTPTESTTIAANSRVVGNVISNAGITVGANTTWIGRALAFGGTVTTDTTTITVPSCGSEVFGSFGNGNTGNTNVGTIGGTVTGTTSGGGSSGGGSITGGVVFSAPVGTVLGSSTNQVAFSNTGTPTVLGVSTSPLFPDTGFPTRAESTPWIAILSFATIILLSNLLIGEFRKNKI